MGAECGVRSLVMRRNVNMEVYSFYLPAVSGIDTEGPFSCHG